MIPADLVGHGASDAPPQKYTVAQFPDDLAWLCGELHVERAVLVGHSMGGVVALELAGRYPQVAAAVCLIDSVVFPSEACLAQLGQLGEQLATTNYTEVLQRAATSLFIEKDDPERKTRLLAKMAKTPQHVAVPALRGHLRDYDLGRAALASRVPTAYIAATNLMSDLDQFRRFCPQLETGQTMGSGHFSQLEVPEQINAMLERFVTISVSVLACGDATPHLFRPKEGILTGYLDRVSINLSQAAIQNQSTLGKLHPQTIDLLMGRRNPNGQTRYSLKCQSSWRGLDSTATRIIECPARQGWTTAAWADRFT